MGENHTEMSEGPPETERGKLRRWLASSAPRTATRTDGPGPRSSVHVRQRAHLSRLEPDRPRADRGGTRGSAVPAFNLHGLGLIVAVPLIVLGAALALASYLHWEDSERAMRLGRPLRYSWMPVVLTGGIALIALCGGILAVVDRLVH